MTAYTPLRRCFRRVELHKDVRFVPYLGESAVPRALSRSIVLKNGWQLVDSDGSDASESDDDNRPKDYYSMGPGTRRAAERRGRRQGVWFRTVCGAGPSNESAAERRIGAASAGACAAPHA